MKVSIKDFAVEMDIRNNGLELEVRNNSGKHQGDVFVTKTGLTWCKGRTRRENGVRVSWEKFTEWMES